MGQIIAAIGIIEHQSEWKIKPHYMKEGGAPGSLKGLKSFWDPVGFTSKMSPEKLEHQRLSELKNGRLAMLGITSVLIANTIPGSIPLPINFPDAAAFVLPFWTSPQLSVSFGVRGSMWCYGYEARLHS